MREYICVVNLFDLLFVICIYSGDDPNESHEHLFTFCIARCQKGDSTYRYRENMDFRLRDFFATQMRSKGDELISTILLNVESLVWIVFDDRPNEPGLTWPM
jgi:hypothetical protein